ncbi:hypothetical protein [Tenacibaculum finnmarkense]|uniref:hypothetical protein n=1 Tax=Tenacibaculum finnmarkense TaxID=2781243 RepID=UPI001E5A275E|nr:hypothetical protein [Tenacibaculum finnmarkense]MCD8413711.1 hypothetical protein [Tenacibaculum finnmarkense genomovar ulcerans]
MNDDTIDKLLAEINNSEKYIVIIPPEKLKHNEILNNILYLKEDLKVVRKPFKESNLITLTPFGIEIIENGGWIKYKKLKKDKEERLEKKLEYDLKISKLKSKTILPVLFLGAFGGVYSLIKISILIISMLSTEEPRELKLQTELEISNKKMETKYQKLSDSLRNQYSLKND